MHGAADSIIEPNTLPGTLLFLLIWTTTVILAWRIGRRTEEEREALGNATVGTLLHSFEETRNREQWSLETENVARRVRTRALASVLLAVSPLAVFVALPLLHTARAPEVSIEDELDEDERPRSRTEPQAEKTIVRTYRRTEGDRGPPEVIEEYRVETLEEKRDPIRLYGTAKVSAKYNVDELLGITITNIQPGSFWEMVGFHEGDFILEANGELMDNPNTSVAFMNSMHTAPEVIVRVRGTDDVERTLVYNAPDE